ncbi:MAG: hypothetical protein WC648_04130 [Candidatus Paceibacterota bacterium]|jgi:hypothetical protein
MTDIYVVSKEYWDDYEIIGVFDSYNLADKFVKTIRTDSRSPQPEISLYPLNPYQKEIEEGLGFYKVKDNKGEYQITKTCDFSTPIDNGEEKIYKVWAKDSTDALNQIKHV